MVGRQPPSIARLTNSLVANLPAPAVASAITWDATTKGFGVRVWAVSARHPKGGRSYLVNYRTAAGTERRYTIGDAVNWSAEEARKEAGRILRRVDAGGDPVAARKAERAGDTVKALCDAYLAHVEREKRLAPRTIEEQRARIENVIIRRLGNRKLADVSDVDVKRLHSSMSATPVQANHVHSDLRRLFYLADTLCGFKGANPARGVQRFAEHSRDRYLTPDELRRLLATLDAWKDRNVASLVRLTVLTGARRGELFAATWGQFDLEAGTWTKPAATTKQKTLHHVPLSPEAVALLVAIRPEHAQTGDLVFPGRKAARRFDNIKRSWVSICTAAGLVVRKLDDEGRPIERRGKPAMVPSLRFHDLRHSYASFLASSGLSLPVIGALLGHSNAATTKRYAHLMTDTLREATARVGALVTAVAKGKTAEVVPLRNGGA